MKENAGLPARRLVHVTLEGGPDGLPHAIEVEPAVLTERKLKIHRGNRYEHFELVARTEESGPAVFRWTMHTKVAE